MFVMPPLLCTATSPSWPVLVMPSAAQNVLVSEPPSPRRSMPRTIACVTPGAQT
jgi:hypothetical protein